MPLAELINKTSAPRFSTGDGGQQAQKMEAELKKTGCKNLWDNISATRYRSKEMGEGGIDVEVFNLGIKIIESQVEKHCGSVGKTRWNSRL